MKGNQVKLEIVVDTQKEKVELFNNGIKTLDGSFTKASKSAQALGDVSTKVAKGMAVYNVVASTLEKIASYFGKAVESGYAFNSSMENAMAGLNALTVATSSNITTTGRMIDITEKYRLANESNVAVLERLKDINAETPHTMEQTMQIYKAMYPYMVKVGASTKDMVELTKNISIAAGAAGVEFNQLLAGVDGLATGTVLANSDLGRFLSSLGITNKKLKESDDVVKLLKDNFSSFKAADTMTVTLSNLQNAWDQLAGELTKDIFDATKGYIKETTSYLDDFRAGVDVLFTYFKDAKEVTTSAQITQKLVQYQTELNELLAQSTTFMWNADKKERRERIAFLEKEIDLLVKKNDALHAPKSTKEALTLKEIDPREKFKKEIEANNKYYAELRKKAEKEATQAIAKYEKELLDTRLADEKYYNAHVFASRVNSYEKLKQERAKRKAERLADIQAEGELALMYYNEQQNAVKELTSSIDELGAVSQDWTAGLEGTAKSIANMSNAFLDLANYSNDYNKVLEAIGKSNLEGEKQAELARQAEKKHISAQIAGYGNLAGTMAGMFEDGSDAAKAMISIQTALSVATGMTAIANAMAQGDGYTAVARGAAVAAALMSYGINMQGGGASGSTPTSANITAKDKQYGVSLTPDIRNFSDLFTQLNSISFDEFQKGLDEASKSLEKFGNVGTAQSESLNALKAEKQKLEDAWDFYYNMGTASIAGIALKIEVDGKTYYFKDGGMYKYYQEKIQEIDKQISDAFTDALSGSIDYSRLSYEEIQKIIPSSFDLSGYNSLLDELNTLAIKAKKGQLSESEASRVNAIINSDTYKTGQDYQDAIDTKNKLEEESTKNIKSWTDSLKSADEIAQELADSMGVSLAYDMDSLNDLFIELSKSGGELTSTELDLLNKNKALISGLQDTRTQFEKIVDLTNQFRSIDLTISKLRGDTDQTKLQQAGQIYADFASSLGYSYSAQEVIDRFLNASIGSLEAWNAQLTEKEQLTSEALGAFNTIMDYRLNNLDNSVEKAAQSFDSLVSTLNGVKDTVKNTLSSIYGDNIGYINGSYNEALAKARNAQQALIGSPKDAKLAEVFNSAVSELSSQVGGYLNKGNYGSKFDYLFTQATAANTFKDFANTASSTEDYLYAIQKATEATAAALKNPVKTNTAAPKHVSSSYGSAVGGSNPSGSTTANDGLMTAMTLSMGVVRVTPEEYAKYKGIKYFADGGIVNAPTLGLIGEAGYSEAVIPLKDPNDPLSQKELIKEVKALRAQVVALTTVNEIGSQHIRRLDERDERYKRRES